MEKLPVEFIGRGEVYGVTFYQLFRHGMLYIYVRIDSDGFTSYEVIEAIPNKAGMRIIGGVTIEYAAKETYPKGDRWGAHERGTTFLSKAINYFNLFAKELKYEVELNEEMLADNLQKAKNTYDEKQVAA